MENITIALASGKGGTGKTTISVNLAYSLAENFKNIQLIDCDVEEPNSKIFLNDSKLLSQKKRGIKIPIINENQCTYCGKCAEVCEYGAIAVIKKAKKTFVSDDLCHGCGACSYFCPENAITEQQKNLGKISYHKYKNIEIVEGRLNLGESIGTPLLRDTLKEISKNKITILDAPPGTSCSMVETVSKSDFVALVTEPTPFGVNDLKLALELVRDMQKPYGIIINKAKFGNNEIYKLIKKEKIPLLLEIPFDIEIAKIYSNGGLIVKKLPKYKTNFIEAFNKIQTLTEV